MLGSVALLVKQLNFPGLAYIAQAARIIPASVENWSVNDMAAAASIANWPLRIMWISSVPASKEPAARNDFKLSIGLVTRLMAR
jgi:hypothetical protein